MRYSDLKSCSALVGQLRKRQRGAMQTRLADTCRARKNHQNHGIAPPSMRFLLIHQHGAKYTGSPRNTNAGRICSWRFGHGVTDFLYLA